MKQLIYSVLVVAIVGMFLPTLEKPVAVIVKFVALIILFFNWIVSIKIPNKI